MWREHYPCGMAPATSSNDTPVDSSVDTVESLRERKKHATRKAIEDAAWELFCERGYAATSIDDIAERASVAPRTFFRYFPTKEDVLYGEAFEAMAALDEAFHARPADEPLIDSLVAAIEHVTSRFRKDRKSMLQRFQMQREAGVEDMGESVRLRFGKKIADLVRERLADSPDAELRSKLVSTVLMSTNAVANDYWLSCGAEGDPGDCFAECLGLLRSILGQDSAAPR